MQSLEEVVAIRKLEFAAYKAQQEAARLEKEKRSRSRIAMLKAQQKREASGIKKHAQSVDPDVRPGRSRRNGASLLDHTGRYSRILYVLQSLNTHFKNNYCFPKQKTILLFLKNSFGLDMSVRQLNYDLSSMDTQGLIRRKRRLSWGKFTSTIYFITKRATRWLSALKKAFGFFTSCRVQNFADNRVPFTKGKVIKGSTSDSGGIPPPVIA